jgi:uncharacterized phage infection (PIP) family protein YhgE
MSLLAAPIEAAFELQRTALEEGRRAADASIGMQDSVNRSVVSGVESQHRIQRRLLSMQQVSLHRLARRVEERSPGPPNVTAEMLEVIDEQYDQLYESQQDLFDGLSQELENGTEAYEELALDSLAALDEQLELLRAATEQLEAQSIEAAEQLEDQLALFDAQLADIEAQLDRAQELTGELP